MFRKAITYLQNVRKELSKVTWPSREQLMESTAITLTLSIILAIFIFAWDFVISRVINFII